MWIMSKLLNKFVPVLLLIGGASLTAPSTTFAKGGHGGGTPRRNATRRLPTPDTEARTPTA